MKIIEEDIKIVKILDKEISNSLEKYYTIVWLRKKTKQLWIEGEFYENTTDTMFFLSSKHLWKILKDRSRTARGYVIYLKDSLLNKSFLSSLQINEIRILYANEVLQANINPAIGKRLNAIIEMLQEVANHSAKHREEALCALINIFFIYCDGQCKLQVSSLGHTHKSVLVYEFNKLLCNNLSGFRKVCQYAEKLNVSPAYLNECTHEVLGVSAKNLIIEQLVRQAKYALKFTDESVKEIAYDLGFSSPDYFSSFCKKQMGQYPSEIQKVDGF